MKNRGRYVLSSEHADQEGSWAVSYGDMVTLLLTFFIIFFTVDKFNVQRSMRIDMNHAADRDEMSRDIASALEGALGAGNVGEGRSGSDNVGVDEGVRNQTKGKVFREGEKIIVEFSGVSFFQSGDTKTTAAARAALKKFYERFNPYVGNYNVSIRAYTDSRRVKTSIHAFKDNLELSALRSVSVMRDLQKFGIPLANMRLGGYGELKFSDREIAALPEPSRKKTDLQKLARTATLVIEPKESK